jgi:hypothetical protein
VHARGRAVRPQRSRRDARQGGSRDALAEPATAKKCRLARSVDHSNLRIAAKPSLLFRLSIKSGRRADDELWTGECLGDCRREVTGALMGLLSGATEMKVPYSFSFAT